MNVCWFFVKPIFNHGLLKIYFASNDKTFFSSVSSFFKFMNTIEKAESFLSPFYLMEIHFRAEVLGKAIKCIDQKDL